MNGGRSNEGGGKRLGFLLLAALATAAFAALGAWQVERRTGKLDLIARVEARLAAAPAPAPAPSSWPAIDPAAEAYRRVEASGTFLHERETLVAASTVHGPGFWVMTPLRVGPGEAAILVNRGFVPADRRDPRTREAAQVGGTVRVTGLLRASEPGGDLLRANDPAAGRWYSRDVSAIARARAIGEAAPFFIDADATPNGGGLPIGGLTVVAFRNSHLVYALTWFGLAGLSGMGFLRIWRARPTPEAASMAVS